MHLLKLSDLEHYIFLKNAEKERSRKSPAPIGIESLTYQSRGLRFATVLQMLPLLSIFIDIKT